MAYFVKFFSCLNMIQVQSGLSLLRSFKLYILWSVKQ